MTDGDDVSFHVHDRLYADTFRRTMSKRHASRIKESVDEAEAATHPFKPMINRYDWKLAANCFDLDERPGDWSGAKSGTRTKRTDSSCSAFSFKPDICAQSRKIAQKLPSSFVPVHNRLYSASYNPKKLDLEKLKDLQRVRLDSLAPVVSGSSSEDAQAYEEAAAYVRAKKAKEFLRRQEVFERSSQAKRAEKTTTLLQKECPFKPCIKPSQRGRIRLSRRVETAEEQAYRLSTLDARRRVERIELLRQDVIEQESHAFVPDINPVSTAIVESKRVLNDDERTAFERLTDENENKKRVNRDAESRSEQANIGSSKTVSSPTLVEFYKRNLAWDQKRKQQWDREKDELENRSLAECTFAPAVSVGSNPNLVEQDVPLHIPGLDRFFETRDAAFHKMQELEAAKAVTCLRHYAAPSIDPGAGGITVPKPFRLSAESGRRAC